jgi:hypothetical protein
MVLVRREYVLNRFPLYHIAAMQIQYAWRSCMRRHYGEEGGDEARWGGGYGSLSPGMAGGSGSGSPGQRRRRELTPEERAAGSIQRCWRGFTDLRIFRYYADLIKFRGAGDAAVMLKSINPREAGLIDAASGVVVRFRLGGNVFPPTIYYKLFTRRPLCDVGAFAPKDYTIAKQPTARTLHNRDRPPLMGPRAAGPALYAPGVASATGGGGFLARDVPGLDGLVPVGTSFSYETKVR